jgi:hypothetical protein
VYAERAFIRLWLYSPLLDRVRFFNFLIFYTVGRTHWTRDQLVARPLPTHRTAQTQNKSTQTSLPPMAFEATIPLFERAKTVHALDRAATVIGFGRSFWRFKKSVNIKCPTWSLGRKGVREFAELDETNFPSCTCRFNFYQFNFIPPTTPYSLIILSSDVVVFSTLSASFNKQLHFKSVHKESTSTKDFVFISKAPRSVTLHFFVVFPCPSMLVTW